MVHRVEGDYVLLVIGHADPRHVPAGRDHQHVELSKLAVNHLVRVAAQCSIRVRSWTRVDHVHRLFRLKGCLFRFWGWLHCLAESTPELVQRQAHQRSD